MVVVVRRVSVRVWTRSTALGETSRAELADARFDWCLELLLEKLKLDVASTEGPYEAWMVRPALLLALSLMTVCDSDLRSNRSVAARSCSFSWVTSVSTVLVCSVVLLVRNVRDRVSLRR